MQRGRGAEKVHIRNRKGKSDTIFRSCDYLPKINQTKIARKMRKNI